MDAAMNELKMMVVLHPTVLEDEDLECWEDISQQDCDSICIDRGIKSALRGVTTGFQDLLARRH